MKITHSRVGICAVESLGLITKHIIVLEQVCQTRGPGAACGSLGCFTRPKSVLKLHMMCCPKCPNFKKFQVSNPCQISTCVPLLYNSCNNYISVKRFSVKSTYVSACGKIEKRKKHILSLSLELVEVSCYDFPHPCDGPLNNHLFCKQALVGI
jgi:hypothetical protein